MCDVAMLRRRLPFALAFALATASCGALIELDPVDEPPGGRAQGDDAAAFEGDGGADADAQEQDDASSGDASGKSPVDACGTTSSGFDDSASTGSWTTTRAGGGAVGVDTGVKWKGGGSVRMDVPLSPNAAAFLEQEFASDCAFKSLSAHVYIVDGPTSSLSGRPIVELVTSDGASLQLRLTGSSSTFTLNGAGGVMGPAPVPKNAWVAISLQCFDLASESRCSATIGATTPLALSLPSFGSVVSKVRIGILPSPQGAGSLYFDDVTIEN